MKNITYWVIYIALLVIGLSCFETTENSYDEPVSSFDSGSQNLVVLLDRIDKLEKTLLNKTDKTYSLYRNDFIINDIQHDSYIVSWYKNLKSEYIDVNDLFLKEFSIASNKQSIVGKTDTEVFKGTDSKLIKEWRKHDLEVMSTLQMKMQIEKVFIDSTTVSYLTIKYPIFKSDGTTLLGSGGVAIRLDNVHLTN